MADRASRCVDRQMLRPQLGTCASPFGDASCRALRPCHVARWRQVDAGHSSTASPRRHQLSSYQNACRRWPEGRICAPSLPERRESPPWRAAGPTGHPRSESVVTGRRQQASGTPRQPTQSDFRGHRRPAGLVSGHSGAVRNEPRQRQRVGGSRDRERGSGPISADRRRTASSAPARNIERRFADVRAGGFRNRVHGSCARHHSRVPITRCGNSIRVQSGVTEVRASAPVRASHPTQHLPGTTKFVEETREAAKGGSLTWALDAPRQCAASRV